MDVRAQITFVALSVLFIAGCGEADQAEFTLPNVAETCGGNALQQKYIVHFKDGHWDYVTNANRNNFKEKYVRPILEKIDFIEYDQSIHIDESSTPTQTAPGIDNWGAAAIHADTAWKNNIRGENVVVAVVDTGVDIVHSQLASQIYYNEGEAGDKKNNLIDDDNNGFVDDYAGYNFYAGNSDVTDDVNHGTHVAGIISAHHADSQIQTGYVQGIAPAAKILPVKFLGATGGSLSGALRGIDYAVLRGAQVINASWGGPGCSQSLRQKMFEVSAKNILMVVAAGNSGANIDLAPEYPAAFNLPLQITVGAITSLFNTAYYSNYSRNSVHIFAPGTGIVSTIPGNNYASLSGTSMAAPFVTGAAAIAISSHPDWSLSQIRKLIFNMSEGNPDYMNVTHGRLSLANIINATGL